MRYDMIKGFRDWMRTCRGRVTRLATRQTSRWMTYWIRLRCRMPWKRSQMQAQLIEWGVRGYLEGTTWSMRSRSWRTWDRIILCRMRITWKHNCQMQLQRPTKSRRCKNNRRWISANRRRISARTRRHQGQRGRNRLSSRRNKEWITLVPTTSIKKEYDIYIRRLITVFNIYNLNS
jgi:hypothetical protein